MIQKFLLILRKYRENPDEENSDEKKSDEENSNEENSNVEHVDEEKQKNTNITIKKVFINFFVFIYKNGQ